MKYNIYFILTIIGLFLGCTKVEVLPENANTNPYDKDYSRDILDFVKTA